MSDVQPTRFGSLVAVMASLAGASACVGPGQQIDLGEYELPELQVVGDHLELGISGDRVMCGGSIAVLERHIEGLEHELGVELAARQRLRYFWLDEDDYIEQTPCRQENHACSLGDVVFARYVPELHEVTHAFTFAVWGTQAELFFEEGLAVVFGDDFGIGTGVPVHDDVWDHIGNAESYLSPEGYHRAGHFTAYLRQEFGLLDLYPIWEQTVRGDTLDNVSSAFEHAFDQPLTEVVNAYGPYPDCDRNAMRVPMAECGFSTLAWPNDGVLTHEQVIACAASNVIGPMRESPSQIAALINFEVERDGDYEITLAGDADYSADLVDCDLGCADAIGLRLRSGETIERHLRAGRYYVKYWAPLAGELAVGLTLSPVL